MNGFPNAYTAAYMLIQIVGFLCIGLVAAPVLGRQKDELRRREQRKTEFTRG